MRITIEIITPERAALLLERNTHNRLPKQAKIIQYTRDMISGRWTLTGEAIKIAADGTLLDGQNRLMACVRAGVSFETVVCYDVDLTVQNDMDGGATRTVADTLKMPPRSLPQSDNVAASARAVWMIQNDRILTGNGPTKSEHLRWIDANPAILDAVRLASKTRAAGGLPVRGSVLAAVLFLIMEVADIESVEMFAKQLKTGENLYSGMSTYAARRYFDIIYRSPNKPTSVTMMAVLIKAWNGFIRDQNIKQLAWRRGSEAFPRVLAPLSFDEEG